MDKMPHPFVTLRRKIRQAGRQYRHPNDNSQSLFHPTSGFTYGYDIREVEQALDAYELTLDTELDTGAIDLSPEEHLRQEAELISRAHTSKDARAFAQDVLDYLAIVPAPIRRAPVASLFKPAQSEGPTE